MINVSELRLGNAVRGGLREMTVVCIEWGTVYTREKGDGPNMRDSHKPEKIQPIELTNEIIRKLGFVTMDSKLDFVEWARENDPLFCLVQDGNGQEYPFYFEYNLGVGDVRVEVKYLHHLQNLYYTIKGEELAI